MTACWASSLGDCADGMSREHYFSDRIFDGELVTAIGLPWCRDEPKVIGMASAVAKILCARHNSQLSNFDKEAAKLSRFLSVRVYGDETAEQAITLDGIAIEKWALKTFFNLGFIRALHREQPNPITPPADLVRYLYRDGPIADGVGLYFVSGPISTDDLRPGVWWNAVQHPQRRHEVFGMTFTFFSLRFVISIRPCRAEDHIARMGEVNGFDFSKAQIAYRPEGILFVARGDAGSKQINLDWRTARASQELP
jgi:hypothetical protein